MSSREKRSHQSRPSGFGLHSFPDISVDGTAEIRRCLRSDENFQRIQYQKLASNRTGSAIQSDDEGTCTFQKDSLSTAQLNEQAYQEGFADGQKKGMIDAEKTWLAMQEEQIKPILMSLQEALLQLNDIRKETHHEIEIEVVELALAIARQVICQEVTIDKEIVMCVAREALAKVEDPGRVKIKMSPSDLKFIKETKSKLSKIVEDIDNITLEAVENIQGGGCIIETDFGEIDARIEKQLQAIEESFRTALGKT